GPDSGVLSFDGTLLNYAGLEPITISGVPNVEIHGTAGNDQLVLEEASPTLLRVRATPASLESVSFSKAGLTSLQIDALGGVDSITINEDVTLSGGLFSLHAETITVSSGVAIDTGTGNVDLIAQAGDATQVTSSSGVVDRIAAVTVMGDITSTGSVTISASVTSDVNVEPLIGTMLSATRSATVTIDGATVNAASVSITASTTGSVTVDATSAIGLFATNDFTENAVAQVIGDASITAGSVSVSATSSTD